MAVLSAVALIVHAVPLALVVHVHVSGSTDPLWATVVVALASALLGALAGGLISYNVTVAAEANHRAALTKIRRKAKIYTPIRDELVDLRADLKADDHIFAGIRRERPRGDYAQRPALWRWREIVEDGRASASPTVRARLEDVDSAADAFNASVRVARHVIEERAAAVVTEIGLPPPPSLSWTVEDMEHLVRDSLMVVSRSSTIGPAGTPLSDRHNEFVERWRADVEAQAAAKHIRDADATLATAVDAAVGELDRAMARIAHRYEKETPED